MTMSLKPAGDLFMTVGMKSIMKLKDITTIDQLANFLSFSVLSSFILDWLGRQVDPVCLDVPALVASGI